MPSLLKVPWRVPLEEIPPDLIRLRLAPICRGDRGDFAHRVGPCEHGHLFRRKRTVINVHVVDRAVEAIFRTTSAADAQGFLGREGLIQFIQPNVDPLDLTVNVQLHPGCLSGAVVCHGDVVPPVEL